MDAGALLDLLGNENRRRILRLLSRKPCYVTEISEHLGVSPKAVIDHLRTLEDAGVIESRVDDGRRKYFHIAENLRLEVTVAPHGVGMKSAYPASPSLDLSRSCQHVTVEVSRNGHLDDDIDTEAVSDLAAELAELDDLERELSLAQRWVQGRMSNALERLSDHLDTEEYIDAEITAAIADGRDDVEAIADSLEIPPPIVSDRLRRLAEKGVLEGDGEGWAIAET